MSNQLLLPKYADTTYKPPALVIPIRNYIKKNDMQEETFSKKTKEKEQPFFYTKPIFKANKYDFL